MSILNNMPKPWSPDTRVVWGIIATSIAFHIIIYALSSTTLKNWSFIHTPLHTLVEVSGTAIALLVAYKLLSLRHYNIGPRHATRIAQALIVIGILDGFHAASQVGNNFVWLHSIATFFGGVFFLLIFLPEHILARRKHTLAIAAATVCIGAFSQLFPATVPAMIVGTNFTLFAELLNLTGGVFLIVAALRLIAEYHLSNSVEDLLFSMHCLLFGLAALMFQSSVLWDAAWWGWHLLRVLAYLAALVFVILSETRLLQQFGHYSSVMNQMAITDSLTNVYNRRYFDEQLRNEYERALRYGNKLTMVILDVDHFKDLNDQHGHTEGDKVLVRLAAFTKQHLRSNDILARVGGEEFAILLPSTSKEDALVIIERIRQGFEGMSTLSNVEEEMRVTASFGIAELTPDIKTERKLFEYADRALYTAKQNGRNQTVIYTRSSE